MCEIEVTLPLPRVSSNFLPTPNPIIFALNLIIIKHAKNPSTSSRENMKCQAEQINKLEKHAATLHTQHGYIAGTYASMR